MPQPLSTFQGRALYVDAMISVGLLDAESRWHHAARRLFETALHPGRPIQLVTAVLTIDEVVFVLLQELVARAPYGIARSRSQYLVEHPDVVSALMRAIEAPVQSLLDLLALESVHAADVSNMTEHMAAVGLLPRDALHIAVMHRLGLTALASGDAAFDRCPGIVRFSP